MSADTLRELSQFDLESAGFSSRQALGGIDRNSPLGLRDINRLSATIFRDDPLFQSARHILGANEASKGLVLRAVLAQDFPGDQEFDPQKYQLLLAAASTKQTIARRMIIQLLDQGGNFGLQSFEQDVLKTACNVAGHFDELGILWMRNVKLNPSNAKAQELGLTNPYTVIEHDAGQYQQVAWATRYPDQIAPITEQFNALSRRLKDEENKDARGLATYFELYSEALKQKDPSELERVWDRADENWMTYLGRVQPIGANYGYHDPNRLRVFPAFSLTVEFPEFTDPLDMTKRAMVKHLRNRYGRLSSFQATAKALEQSHVFVVVQAVTAGSLDLVFAGLNFRSKEQAKIFVNPELVAERFNQAKDLASKVFRAKQDRRLVDEIEIPLTVIGTTFAGHEFGEGLFLSEEVKKTLGEKTISNLHEGLGDLTIAGIMRDAIEDGDLPERSLLAHVVRNLTFCLRIISLAESTSMHPYSRNVLSWLRRMTESGFITKRKDGWHINPKATDRLYDLVGEDLEQHVKIAETKDADLAASYLSKTTENPAVADLVTTVKQAGRKS